MKRAIAGLAILAALIALGSLLAGELGLIAAGGSQEAGDGKPGDGGDTRKADRQSGPGMDQERGDALDPDPSLPEDEAAETMRRLARIGARFGARGGEWVEIELPEEYQNQPVPAASGRDFTTDFSRAAISYEDIIAGGPPKDGIPSIDEPRFITVGEADQWLEASEPVILFRHEGQARIYPLQILTWHEIVNDQFSGLPIAVTYCPLCNTGMVFDRRFYDEVLELGVSGRLIYSNMIMYDRQTESWWIQATGQGIAGKFAGQRLRLLPSGMLSWADAREAYPEAEVLSRDTGHRRNYGRNPYAGYDSAERPFLYRGPEVVPAGSNPMERVLTVYHGEAVEAVPYSLLEREGVVELELDGRRVVVFWQSGTASALDAQRVPEGRDVGSAAAYYAEIAGRSVSFERYNDRIRDRDTGSTWDIAGRAVDGDLAGAVLEQALSVEHFLFSYRAFHTGRP